MDQSPQPNFAVPVAVFVAAVVGLALSLSLGKFPVPAEHRGDTHSSPTHPAATTARTAH